jgi:hypothetical protein
MPTPPAIDLARFDRVIAIFLVMSGCFEIQGTVAMRIPFGVAHLVLFCFHLVFPFSARKKNTM